MLFATEVLDVPMQQIKKAHDYSRAFPLSFVALEIVQISVRDKSENTFIKYVQMICFIAVQRDLFNNP